MDKDILMKAIRFTLLGFFGLFILCFAICLFPPLLVILAIGIVFSFVVGIVYIILEDW